MNRLLVLLSIIIPSVSLGQDGTLIGNKPTAIESSAELEIYSTTKGVLLPRVASVSSITAPATGLLVYDESVDSYSYYDGSVWILMPVSKFAEIRDLDNDTRVSTELTADADQIEFEIASASAATLDTSGLNLTTGTYQINGARIATSSATSIYLGENAGGGSPSSSNNTIFGTNAGTQISSGTKNALIGTSAASGNDISSATIIGYGAGASSVADGNVFIGSNAGSANTSGNENVFLGTEAGSANTTGSGNTFIGHNSANGHATGDNNTVIGTGVSLTDNATDSIKIGNIIAVGNEITFNNEYTFPTTAGTEGQTLVLDSDNETLIWVDAGVSAVDQTVIGSAAGLYSFDIGSKSSSDITTLQYAMFITPLTASANAYISQLMVWKKVANNRTMQMALYDEDFNLLSTTETRVVPGNPKISFETFTLTTGQNVESDKTYYIGVRASGGATDYAQSTAATGTGYFMEADGQTCNASDGVGVSYDEAFPAVFKASDPSFPAGYKRCTRNNTVPWVRAF